MKGQDEQSCSFLKRLADSAEDFLNVKEEGQARGIRPSITRKEFNTTA